MFDAAACRARKLYVSTVAENMSDKSVIARLRRLLAAARQRYKEQAQQRGSICHERQRAQRDGGTASVTRQNDAH